MIERIYILESVDPVIFYGVNNANMQLIKTLFPKLRIVARGNVMKVIGDEDESELFLKKIPERRCHPRHYQRKNSDSRQTGKPDYPRNERKSNRCPHRKSTNTRKSF